MNNEKLDYFQTKSASEVLDVSVSSMRLYAQTMESLGYKFRMINKNRMFNKYDLLIITRAMKRYKLVGGTMKESLHFIIVCEKYGEEKAEKIIDDLYVDKKAEKENNQCTKEIVKSVSSMILDENQRYYNNLVDCINEMKTQENLRLALSDSKDKYLKAEKQKTELEMELLHVSRMNTKQFKNWKKTREEL